MVDTLVSGASASRRVGSTPISGTKVRQKCRTFFFCVCKSICYLCKDNLGSGAKVCVSINK